MPQHSMFLTDRRLYGIRVELLDRTPDLVDGFDLTIATYHNSGPWESLHSSRWNGVMMDLMSGTFGDLASSFLYGEGARDILREAQTSHRVAKAHKRLYGPS